MKKLFNLLFITSIILFSSCTDDDMKVKINNPSTYSFERNGTSSVSFSGQTTRIKMGEELISALKTFSFSEEQLLEMFSNQTTSGDDANPFFDSELNESTKSIRSKVAASADFFSANTVGASSIKADFESWISAQVNEVFPNQNVLAVAGTAGQIADESSIRYVNAKGLEYNQAVNKGLIGGLMVDQALNNYLSSAVLDAADNIVENDAETVADGKNYTNMEHKWDEAYGYLYGTSNNYTDPNLTIGNDDNFLNKYIGRVEGDDDFAGIADDIWQAFKLGRAAIVAGEYDVRDEQADIIREKVSTIVGVRAVYYLQQGKNAILTGNMGTAFHDLSEGYGFIYSLQFTRQPNSNDPYFSKTEVEGFLIDLMDDGANGLWDVSETTLDNISEAIASRFDFTVAQTAE